MAELRDGFAYRCPSAEPWAATALDLVAAERPCCPVLTAGPVFEPGDGPVRLRLRGFGAIKAFVLAELDGITPRAEKGV